MLLIILFGSALCFGKTAVAGVIDSYEPIFSSFAKKEGKPGLAIRRFVIDGRASLLVVDPYTLDTAVVPAADGTISAVDGYFLQQTPYVSALGKYTALPSPLQNAGVRHAEGGGDGVYLTVDLCPSSKNYEKELFERLRNLPQVKPVPIALAVTKGWMDRHELALEELRALEVRGEITITWVNHSASHPYHPHLPLERNFLLGEGVDFRKEVLANEQALLARGLIPSPFFRFPGLVSDAGLMTQLKALSLIPIGSDAWLAKGEKPTAGSIVLVHGNGNEPRGIRLFLELLQLPAGRLKLLPLKAAFSVDQRTTMNFLPVLSHR